MIEVRYMTTNHVNGRGSRVCLDEVVAHGGSVHIEDLGRSWSVRIDAPGKATFHADLPKSEHIAGDALVREVNRCNVTVDGEPSGAILR